MQHNTDIRRPVNKAICHRTIAASPIFRFGIDSTCSTCE
jgi:hypothetical protein